MGASPININEPPSPKSDKYDSPIEAKNPTRSLQQQEYKEDTIMSEQKTESTIKCIPKAT